MKPEKSAHEMIVMLIIIIGLLNTGLTAYTFQKAPKIYWFVGVNLIVYILLFVVLFHKNTMENFFFEVSPTRKKCLMEQVSRKNFGKKTGCSCCGKGTTGGIPPNYAQWLGTSDSDTNAWFRPDFVKYVPTDTFNGTGQECQSKSAFTQPVYIQHI